MLNLKVVSKRVEAEGIASYELARADSGPLPAFDAGSHVDVVVPGGQVRQYSLYNPPSNADRYCIAVLRDPASRGGSVSMLDRVSEGDVLEISEPKNHFVLDTSATRSLLFAGGIGVTPILCMAARLAEVGADFALHYCGRALPRMAFVDTLKASGFASKVHVHTDDGPDTQRFDARSAVGEPRADTHLYVCGPTGYMDHVLDTARALGWPEERLHREYFAGAQLDHSNDGAFDVQIKSTGKVIRVAADQSVAQALLDQGIALSVSCEQGVCGTCLTKVLDGVPEHNDMYLTDAERARNDCFMPCCSRASTPRLVLDL